MNILLAFAPFLVFAVMDRFVDPTLGLVGGAVVSAILLARDLTGPNRSPKILEIGTFVLFGCLATDAYLVQPEWSVIAVRLMVDGGLLAIVLLSIVIGKPFTIQYARETVDRSYWDSPKFLSTNYVVTGVWALAFVVMVLAELALLYFPEMPHRLGVAIIVVALVGAVKFTGWYPEKVKRS